MLVIHEFCKPKYQFWFQKVSKRKVERVERDFKNLLCQDRLLVLLWRHKSKIPEHVGQSSKRSGHLLVTSVANRIFVLLLVPFALQNISLTQLGSSNILF